MHKDEHFGSDSQNLSEYNKNNDILQFLPKVVVVFSLHDPCT